MVKKQVQIYSRLKPVSEAGSAVEYIIHPALDNMDQLILYHKACDNIYGNAKHQASSFSFQKVFEQNTKQVEIFDTVAKSVVESVLEGYNGTILAYGQTGSGKTYAMSGGADKYEDRGIIPRAIEYIFSKTKESKDALYSVSISYLEIYNEIGYDLLDDIPQISKLEDLQRVTLLEDTQQQLHLKNLSVHAVHTKEEALNLMFLGDTNRVVADMPKNRTSSRSHCVFTVCITRRKPGSCSVRRAKLHLVDLAGSERVDKTGAVGLELTEVRHINLSLHFLEAVVKALSEPGRRHIPYRTSLLTAALRDSLGGNSMTVMLATISMERDNMEETLSTCRFAQRVALVHNNLIPVEESDPKLEITALKSEITLLKEQLLLLSRGSEASLPLTLEEEAECSHLINQYLKDDNMEHELKVPPDMRKIGFCFQLLKSTVRKTKEEHHPPRSDETNANREDVKKLQELLKQRDTETCNNNFSKTSATSKQNTCTSLQTPNTNEQITLVVDVNDIPVLEKALSHGTDGLIHSFDAYKKNFKTNFDTNKHKACNMDPPKISAVLPKISNTFKPGATYVLRPHKMEIITKGVNIGETCTDKNLIVLHTANPSTGQVMSKCTDIQNVVLHNTNKNIGKTGQDKVDSDDCTCSNVEKVLLHKATPNVSVGFQKWEDNHKSLTVEERLGQLRSKVEKQNQTLTKSENANPQSSKNTSWFGLSSILGLFGFQGHSNISQNNTQQDPCSSSSQRFLKRDTSTPNLKPCLNGSGCQDKVDLRRYQSRQRQSNRKNNYIKLNSQCHGTIDHSSRTPQDYSKCEPCIPVTNRRSGSNHKPSTKVIHITKKTLSQKCLTSNKDNKQLKNFAAPRSRFGVYNGSSSSEYSETPPRTPENLRDLCFENVSTVPQHRLQVQYSRPDILTANNCDGNQALQEAQVIPRMCCSPNEKAHSSLRLGKQFSGSQNPPKVSKYAEVLRSFELPCKTGGQKNSSKTSKECLPSQSKHESTAKTKSSRCSKRPESPAPRHKGSSRDSVKRKEDCYVNNEVSSGPGKSQSVKGSGFGSNKNAHKSSECSEMTKSVKKTGLEDCYKDKLQDVHKGCEGSKTDSFNHLNKERGASFEKRKPKDMSSWSNNSQHETAKTVARASKVKFK